MSFLRRKIEAHRPADEGPAIGPEAAWRRAARHGLSVALGVRVDVTAIRMAEMGPEGAARLPEASSLIVLVDGAAGLGVACFSRSIVAAMVELQMLGRIGRRAVVERPATAADAALVADPLDQLLSAQDTLARELGHLQMTAGFRYATRIEEAHEITLRLASGTMDHVSIDLTIGETNQRTGRIDLVLPRGVPASASEEEPPADFGERLRDRIKGSEVVLTTRLAHLTRPLDDIRAFSPGTVIPLDGETLGSVRLCGPDGAPIAIGRLGRAGDRKAIRLSPGERPAFDALTDGTGMTGHMGISNDMDTTVGMDMPGEMDMPAEMDFSGGMDAD